MSDYPQSDVISVDIKDHVAVVWLDRPEQRNAMAPAFWTEFPDIMDALGTDPEVRVIVVAAKGKSFTVGLDLMAFGPAVMSGDPRQNGRPRRRRPSSAQRT